MVVNQLYITTPPPQPIGGANEVETKVVACKGNETYIVGGA